MSTKSTKTSKSKNEKSSSVSNALQKKVDELNETIQKLKAENETIRNKFRLICHKIVDNIEMSQYSFIEPGTQPENIDIKDLLHMLEQIALLAAQTVSQNMNNGNNNSFESHMEELELRITELTKENGTSFRNKLKLQERLEFIMQERDVWKRNAETLKKLYTKLVKEQQLQSSLSLNKYIVGTYKANLEKLNPNQRTFSATIPREYYENTRSAHVLNSQLKNSDSTLFGLGNENLVETPRLPLQQQQQLQTDSSISYFQKNFDDTSIYSLKNLDNNINNQEVLVKSISSLNGSLVDNLDNKSFPILENNFASSSALSFVSLTNSTNNNNQMNSIELVNEENQFKSIELLRQANNSTSCSNYTETMDRPMTAKKNVSFNKDINVRVFPKNSKNMKSIESFLLPLSQQKLAEQKENSMQTLNHMNSNENNQSNQIDVQEQIKNLLSRRSSNSSDLNSIYSIIQKQSSSNNLNLNQPIENRFTSRASICSNRKFPGDTPVKDLEPTLKMIIIKELSTEKLDGNDWKMFARRIGISENEIKEWTALKLQYPMARVLSFWSTKQEATTRLLHRHLNAPCFNYGALAKRIENFYDVV